MSKEKGCAFCNENSPALAHPLMETDDFRIVCDRHPLTRGHVLIMPKRHFACVGAFDEGLYAPFMELYGLVRNFLQSEYGGHASFEHGVMGQTVYHAHVHLFPSRKEVSEIVPDDGMLTGIGSISDLPAIHREKNGYMFLHVGEAMYAVSQDPEIPGFLREQFARAMGVENRGNWRTARHDPRLVREFERDVHDLKMAWKRVIQETAGLENHA